MENNKKEYINKILRDSLINYSLDNNDKELFMKLTSTNWQEYLTSDFEELKSKVKSILIPEFNYHYFCHIKGKSLTDVTAQKDYLEIIKIFRETDSDLTVPEIRKEILRYKNSNNPNSKVLTFLNYLYEDLDVLMKTKIVKNINYRSIVYIIFPNKVMLQTFDSYAQEINLIDTLPYFRDKAETVCLYFK